MYIVECVFKVNSENIENNYNEILSFTKNLYYNGITLNMQRSLIHNNNSYTGITIVPERESIDLINSKNYNSELNEKGIFLEKVEILGKDVWAPDTCKCSSHSWLILKGSSYIPLYCGDCNKGIPLYKIPPTYHDSTHYGLLNWNKEYDAWEEINFRSKYEKFASKQLSDIKSNLSQNAINIRNNIEKITGVKTYYFLNRATTGKSPKSELNCKCPICSEEWILETSIFDEFDFMCKKCRIISNFSPGNRYKCQSLKTGK